MAPRSIWNGTISLGTIAVPIKVHSATESKTVRFKQVHEPDGSRIEHKRVAHDGEEVPYDDIVKGYEVSEGEYVVLEKEEVDAAAGERSRLLDIEEFVDATEIDPVVFDRTYYLGSRDADDAYRLLHDALEKSDRAGIGRWVFHNREYLVSIRALDGVIGMHTMVFHDELVAVKDLEIPSPQRKPKKQELDMAGKLVESLQARFDPEKFEDTYRERLLEYIEAKLKGKVEALPPREPSQDPDDLMAALEASVSGRS